MNKYREALDGVAFTNQKKYNLIKELVDKAEKKDEAMAQMREYVNYVLPKAREHYMELRMDSKLEYNRIFYGGMEESVLGLINDLKRIFGDLLNGDEK